MKQPFLVRLITAREHARKEHGMETMYVRGSLRLRDVRSGEVLPSSWLTEASALAAVCPDNAALFPGVAS